MLNRVLLDVTDAIVFDVRTEEEIPDLNRFAATNLVLIYDPKIWERRYNALIELEGTTKKNLHEYEEQQPPLLTNGGLHFHIPKNHAYLHEEFHRFVYQQVRTKGLSPRFIGERIKQAVWSQYDFHCAPSSVPSKHYE